MANLASDTCAAHTSSSSGLKRARGISGREPALIADGDAGEKRRRIAHVPVDGTAATAVAESKVEVAVAEKDPRDQRVARRAEKAARPLKTPAEIDDIKAGIKAWKEARVKEELAKQDAEAAKVEAKEENAPTRAHAERVRLEGESRGEKPRAVSGRMMAALRAAGTPYLCYYSKSAKKTAGSGTNEYLPLSAAADRIRKLLPAKSCFRQKLSNFWRTATPFTYKGWRFATAEHAHHWCKYELAAPAVAALFTAESGGPFALDPLLAKRAGGKAGVVYVDGHCVWRRPTTAVANLLGPPAQTEAFLAAKFAHDADARAVLLATAGCALLHVAGRSKPLERSLALERVRDTLLAALPPP
jgi:hypothetical protein